MKKIFAVFITLVLCLNFIPIVINAETNNDIVNNEVVIENNGYIFHAYYDEVAKKVLITIYDGDYYIDRLELAVYDSFDEYKASKGININTRIIVTETETGFGYIEQENYWEYACSQDLVDSGVVNYRGIKVALNKVITDQKDFRKKVDAAILLEEKLDQAYHDELSDLLICIAQSLGGYVNPSFFMGAVSSYMQALGHRFQISGFEGEYTKVNGELADIFVTLHKNRIQ